MNMNTGSTDNTQPPWPPKGKYFWFLFARLVGPPFSLLLEGRWCCWFDDIISILN